MRPRVLSLALLLCGPLALMFASLWSPAPAEAQASAPELEIPFFTVRNRTASDDPGRAYGDERSDLKAGWCRVRERDLSLLAPLAENAPPYIREDLITVDRVRISSSGSVLGTLDETRADRPPLVYVHGFYISFEKGCRRAVLLQQNADLTNRFLWFSWPSDGSLTNYMRDEADLYWSVPDLAETLITLADRSGRGEVDVAGHSLGARGVVLALYEVANRRPDLRLGTVVLLAPDMDVGIFERILPRITPIVENITVYVTSEDRPLALSAQVHGYPRLGEAGNDVSRMPGIEVIDVSRVPGESPTGHLYHAYSPDVGRDLSQLLNEGRTAAARDALVKTGERTWTLRPRRSAPTD